MIITPGEILNEEFLKPMGITAYKVGKDTGVASNRVRGIINGTRNITADTALRLGKYFGTSAQFWMNLQTNYDLKIAQHDLKKVIDKIPTSTEAA